MPSGKKRGRPQTWTEDNYRLMLAARERGEKLLLAKHDTTQVTDRSAMEEVAVREIRRTTMSERDARAFGRKLAKRLSDARKVVRKSVVK